MDDSDEEGVNVSLEWLSLKKKNWGAKELVGAMESKGRTSNLSSAMLKEKQCPLGKPTFS